MCVTLQLLIEYLTPRLRKFREQIDAIMDEDAKTLQLASALAIVHILVSKHLLGEVDRKLFTPLCHALLLKPSSPTTVESYDRLKQHYDQDMLK